MRKNGIIAFTDILGYSSLIENNDAGEQLENILKILNDLPDLIKPEITKNFTGQEKSTIDEDIISWIDSINNLIVSDSILTMLELKDYDDKRIEGLQWVFFIWYISFLSKHFMDYGLPLRGAISTGEYITFKNSFAGKPIIEAYKKGNILNSGGIILGNSCEPKLLEYLKQDFDFFRDVTPLIQFSFPNKNNDSH